MQGKTLIIGAGGQIGIELTMALRAKRGAENVVASDVREINSPDVQDGPFEMLNALDKELIRAVIEKHNIVEVYHLAALLSATSEKYPDKAWDLNINSLFHILDLAREKNSRFFGRVVLLLLVQTHLKTTLHSTPLWNQARCTEFRSSLVNVGANITTQNME